MTLLYWDDLFLEHETGGHPENAGRLRSVIRRLRETGLAARCQTPTWPSASLERLARVHAPEYVEYLRQYANAGGGQIEADTIVSPLSYEVATSAAGAVCHAVERVVDGEDQRALCLVRPPGHHALYADPMGFCLLNSVAVAARIAIEELHLDRVLIVDWDVHHGNGTQDAFYSDPQVGFLSIHRWPFYPGTGARDESGSGQGLGTIMNLPVTYGTPREQYLAMFRAGLETMAERMRPQLVIVSAGFDAHRRDPIGSLGLESHDFAALTEAVQQVAAVHADNRLVSVLEGGYNPDALAESVQLHLETLLGQESGASSDRPEAPRRAVQ